MQRFRKEMLAKLGLTPERRGRVKHFNERYLLAVETAKLSEECKFRLAAMHSAKEAAWGRTWALKVYRMSECSRYFEQPFMPRRYGAVLIRTKSEWIAYLAEEARSSLLGSRALRSTIADRDPFVAATSLP